MRGPDGSTSGSIPFGSSDERERLAVAISGLLAERSIQALTIADPRVCRTRAIVAREANLPREITEAEPGTTIAGEGVALLIDETCVKWVAGAAIAAGLRAIANPSSRNG